MEGGIWNGFMKEEKFKSGFERYESGQDSQSQTGQWDPFAGVCKPCLGAVKNKRSQDPSQEILINKAKGETQVSEFFFWYH